MTALRIFEKHPEADAYRFGPSFTPHAIAATDKHFTDAELAAEYWAQHMEAVKAFDRAYPYGESEELDAENERILTVERFATIPHYDEDTR